jgi:hypothetical protein
MAAENQGESPESDRADNAPQVGRLSQILKEVWLPLLIATLAFIAGIGGSVIGGAYAYKSATSTETAQEAASRDAATQTRRGEVYLAYLDAANTYALASQKLSDDTKRIGKGTTAQENYDNDYGPWQTARSSYQGEVNQVYVYGSDAAWAAHQKVAATLPLALGPDNVGEFTQALYGVKWQQFNAAYDNFLSVFCKEVPAEPRSGC